MSDEIESLKEAITTSATEGIDSVLIDGESVREHSLSDRLRALKELQSQEVGNLTRGGMHHTKLISPGGGG